jgi:putative sigma-54 modulation protein
MRRGCWWQRRRSESWRITWFKESKRLRRGMMELQIEGRHFKLTDSIQEYLEEKLGKLEKFFDGIHRTHVVLDIAKNKRQTVEIVCSVARRQTLVAKGEAEDLYAAIDQAEKKMVTEMKKYKAKLRTVGQRNKGSRMAEPSETEAPDNDGLEE